MYASFTLLLPSQQSNPSPLSTPATAKRKTLHDRLTQY